VTRPRQSRADAERAGRQAETFASLALQLKGYVILAKRAKKRRGKTLAFIEVKMRNKPTDPANVLTAGQMQRIINGATGWAASRPWTQNCQWRYDFVLVTPWRWPAHIKDAWRPQNDPTLESGRKGGNVRASQSSYSRRGRS
jgi:putative endonuclease